eukprot:Tamp_14944.p1 GENE.Tamp_14944~~Tamp_14944.p1  ORF type:complete len:260 (-),score=14.23 Tamp_14944:607-1386(-)
MTAKLMAIVRQHSNIGSPFGSPGGGQEREGSLLSKVLNDKLLTLLDAISDAPVDNVAALLSPTNSKYDAKHAQISDPMHPIPDSICAITYQHMPCTHSISFLSSNDSREPQETLPKITNAAPQMEKGTGAICCPTKKTLCSISGVVWYTFPDSLTCVRSYSTGRDAQNGLDRSRPRCQVCACIAAAVPQERRAARTAVSKVAGAFDTGANTELRVRAYAVLGRLLRAIVRLLRVVVPRRALRWVSHLKSHAHCCMPPLL